MTYQLVGRDDPILHRRAGFVNFDKHDVATLAEEMFRIMLEHAGMGLAAPQIGLSLRMFVYARGAEHGIVINPQIVKYMGESLPLQEGCLSYPSEYIDVARPERVEVIYQGLDRKPIRRSLGGIVARIFQHEYDHLNGIVFHDRVSGKTT